jgi:putative tryptophan/tyrosine transport system substrate-binding protein
MKRRDFITVLGGAAMPIFWARSLHSQSARLPRVGYLTPVPLPFDDEFRRGLQDLGYVHGRNISIEAPFADGKDENLPQLAKQLAELPVDVMVVTNSTATAAAMKATTTIPIVMVTAGDPVGSRFVATLARSGNNVTGLSSLAPEIMLKQLELLKEAVPNVSHVTIFWNPLNPTNVMFFQRAQIETPALGVQLQSVEVRTPQDLDGAFTAASQLNPQSLLFLVDQVTIGRRIDVVRFANAIGCPTMFSLKEFVVAGGLMSFGFDFPNLFYRAAFYVDKILKGAVPTELPIQQPTKFQFVVNLATAKSIGLNLPTSILLRADEVIE